MRGIIQSTDIDLSGYAKLSDLEEGHNYSTNEQVVGTWIDGKPLYEKTLAITVTTDYESVTLADEGITNIDFATMSEYTVVDRH